MRTENGYIIPETGRETFYLLRAALATGSMALHQTITHGAEQQAPIEIPESLVQGTLVAVQNNSMLKNALFGVSKIGASTALQNLALGNTKN